MTKVLVVGASGTLGKLVVNDLKQQNIWLRILGRSEDRLVPLSTNETVVCPSFNESCLDKACKDIDVVFSCLGQSVSPTFSNLRPGYYAIDYGLNHKILQAALKNNVKRFVYVSVFGADNFPNVAYMKAHEDMARAVRNASISHSIIMPTGFFAAYSDLLTMAKNGRGFIFGNGESLSNPIHESELAKVCTSSILETTNQDVPVGGPDILSRKELLELAFQALGKEPKITYLPLTLLNIISTLNKPLAPRISELGSFLYTISKNDLIAPSIGTSKLKDYYSNLEL